MTVAKGGISLAFASSLPGRDLRKERLAEGLTAQAVDKKFGAAAPAALTTPAVMVNSCGGNIFNGL